jgi:hypothetical protein
LVGCPVRGVYSRPHDRSRTPALRVAPNNSFVTLADCLILVDKPDLISTHA